MPVPGLKVVAFMLSVVYLLAVPALPVHAVDGAALQLGRVEGAGWHATGVTLQIDWHALNRAAIVLQAGEAALPDPLGGLTNVRLECKDAGLSVGEISCPAGFLDISSTLLGKQHMPVSFRYALAEGRLEARLTGVRYAGGQFRLTVSHDSERWSLGIRGNRFSLQQLIRQARRTGYTIPALDGDGRLALDVRMDGRGTRLTRAKIDAQLQDAAFSNDDGSVAGEDVNLRCLAHQAGCQGNGGCRLP